MSRAAPAAALGAGDAHVWLVDTGDRTLRRPAWLDSEERGRWARLARAADRDLFLVAHTHLRATLSRYADVPPEAWRFARRPGGRPELHREQANTRLRFSLSHTPGLVACVVTRGAACGVDVERDGRIADWAAVAPWLLSAQERADLAGPQEMLARWTLKEAYVKAIGRGIRAPLRDLSTPPGWQLVHVRPTDAHHLAVALWPRRSVEVRWACGRVDR